MESTQPDRKIVISRDSINELDQIGFSGRINVVKTADQLEYAFSRINSVAYVGFDTESRPSFFKGQKFPVSIIQISLDDEAFIFQLKHTGLDSNLISLLSSDKIKKIGIGVRDDISRLQEFAQFNAAGFIDLSELGKKKGLKQTGARALTALYLGRWLVKSSQKTNWAKQTLTERQLSYAATDAWVCLQILPQLEQDSYKIPFTYSEE